MVEQNSFLEFKSCFRDFTFLDSASKLKGIEEALRLISHIEIDLTSPSGEEGVCSAIEEKVKFFQPPFSILKGGWSTTCGPAQKKRELPQLEECALFYP